MNRTFLIFFCFIATTHAQFSSPVRVVNTTDAPVPVTAQGTTTVGGTVTVGNTAAQPVPVSPQGTTAVSGTVAISGIPTVTIKNPGTTPVPVVNLSEPGRQALKVKFTMTCNASNSTICSGVQSLSQAGISIPSTKRLVIEFVSLATGGPLPNNAFQAHLFISVGSFFQSLMLTPVTSGTVTYFNFNQPTKMYIDPPEAAQTNFLFTADLNQSLTTSGQFDIGVVGYFIECSGGMCQ